jgi:hypothetical protein
MLRLISAAAVALFVSVTPAMAQEDTGSNDDIVVVGERLQEMVRAFVDEVAVSPGGERQMARWDRTICPLVAGIPARQSQYIADRIAQRAHQIGLRTEGPGCKANILIFVTPESGRLAEGIVDEYRNLVNYYSTNGIATLGRGPLEDFVSEQRPVRWWHVNQTVSGDGQHLGGDVNGGTTVLRTTQPAGRLRRETRQDFLRVLIIVDATEASGVQFQALADYLAMVSLAQLDANGEPTGIPSILNLFNDRAAGASAPNGMTEWDEAYLDGLYNAARTAPSELWQQRDISERMVETLDPAAAPAEE